MEAIRGTIAADPPRPWTEREDSLLALGKRMFGSDCCKLARLVGTRSCQEISSAVEVPSQDAGVDCTIEDNDAEIQKDAAKKRTALAKQVDYVSAMDQIHHYWHCQVRCSCWISRRYYAGFFTVCAPPPGLPMEVGT